jgi:hypothetical protein
MLYNGRDDRSLSHYTFSWTVLRACLTLFCGFRSSVARGTPNEACRKFLCWDSMLNSEMVAIDCKVGKVKQYLLYVKSLRLF